MDPLIKRIDACRSEADLIRLLTQTGFEHANATGLVKRIGFLARQEKRVLMKLANLRDYLRVAA